MDHFNLSENVDTLFHSLENFTQKEGVIGKPVVQGEKTFMPVVSLTVGYGGGNAAMGKNPMSGSSSTFGGAGSTTNSGSGALGLGAKITTDAIIVIDNQNDVSMMPMNQSGSQIMDKIPQIISTMNQGKQQQSQPQTPPQPGSF